MPDDIPSRQFIVSFPHYFLQATGHLAEQLKTREWIVARIILITERVVDHQVGNFSPSLLSFLPLPHMKQQT